ncbi:MAG: class I SAM-dependent methyltransferase [Cytophagales bacterium]|nr:class I SAM-dependent methyltransferase [Rhizobacter sp.]
MTLAPSPWVVRWSHLVPQGASVLDVACGSGRHVVWFADRGCRVTGVDRDAAAIEPLRGQGELLVADIETGPWPLPGRQFDAVVVTNYLWRPLLPTLLNSLADGGVWIYETFADGNQKVGKPSNPAFLLQPEELLEAARGLEIVAYENGFLDAPPRFVQRLVAVKLRSGARLPALHGLAHAAATEGRLKSSDSEEPA